MDNFNWRGILAGLTEEQREFLKSLPLSEYIGLICRHVLCSECPLSGCNECIKLKRIELIRREVEPYEKVVEAAKEVVDGVVIGQYGIEGYHKELHFMVAKLGKLIEAVEK